MKFSFRPYMIMQGAVANVGMAARHLLGKLFRNPLPLLIPGFQGWSPFLRHFVQNLLIGVVFEIFIVLGVALHFGPVVDNQDAALDWMMRLSSNGSISDGKHPDQIWIDVDERTYRSKEWGGGEPANLPLEALFKLIEYSLERETKYVIVDFFIDGFGNEQQVLFKQRLQDLLRKHQESHILFMRAIREPLDPVRLASRSVRTSFLDELTSENPQRVHAVAPNFQLSGDHILRHWKLWESACMQLPGGIEGEGRWIVLPSPQLVVAAMVMQNQKKLQQSLPPWTLTVDKEVLKKLPICAMDGLENEEILRRSQTSRMTDLAIGQWVRDNFGVCYLQDRVAQADCVSDFAPYVEKASETQEETTSIQDLGNRVNFRLSDVPPLPIGFQRLPAHYILVPPSETGVVGIRPGQKNQIVVIGASYADSRDFHLTPLGVMPGAMVLINSIDSLCTVGILQFPNLWQKMLSVVVIIVGASAIFAWLPSFWAATAMMTIIVCLLVPISFWLFVEQGVWLDFVVPIIGIYLYREWADLHEKLNRFLSNTTTGGSI